jgi:hypothetical protein
MRGWMVSCCEDPPLSFSLPHFTLVAHNGTILATLNDINQYILGDLFISPWLTQRLLQEHAGRQRKDDELVALEYDRLCIYWAPCVR